MAGVGDTESNKDHDKAMILIKYNRRVTAMTHLWKPLTRQRVLGQGTRQQVGGHEIWITCKAKAFNEATGSAELLSVKHEI